MQDPGQSQLLPLPAEGHGSLEYFKNQIKAAQEKLDSYKDDWDRNVQSYLAKVLDKSPHDDAVIVPMDFANVEAKKANLFYQTPEVQLTAQQPGLEDAVSVFQAVLNHELGLEGVDALSTMHEVLFDALCPSGLMVSKIGYESFTDGTIDVPPPTPEPPVPGVPVPGIPTGPPPVGLAPAGPPLGAQPGAMGLPAPLGSPELGAAPGPMGGASGPMPSLPAAPQTVPNVVFERYSWKRVSPAKVLIPADFRGGNYDRAPWLGFEFEEDWEMAKQLYGLPDDVHLKGHGTDERLLKSEKQMSSIDNSKRVKGWEIWYYASQFDPAVKHPEQQRLLVILDGVDEPVRHEDSPVQKWVPKPNGGKMLAGLRGHPIHVGAIRYVSDTAYPPSETAISRSQTQELNKSRTQMILQRDRNIPMRIADLARIGGDEGLQKIRKNIWQGVIALPSASANDPPIFGVGESHFPQENFQFNNIIMSDIGRVWALAENQRGEESERHRTATEINTIQHNTTARMEAERRQVLDYFVRGARKLGALIQLFADEEHYVQIVGQDGSQRLQAWNKDTIQGEYAYTAKANSAAHVDAAEDLNNALKTYELLAKDPHINRVELLQAIARKANLDATKLIVPQLPPKGPDAPNVSFRFAGQDLDVRSPAFPIILSIMKQAGYQIPDELVQQAQEHAQQQALIMGSAPVGMPLPPNPAMPAGGPSPQTAHGGPAEKVMRLSKRRAEEGGHGPVQ